VVSGEIAVKVKLAVTAVGAETITAESAIVAGLISNILFFVVVNSPASGIIQASLSRTK